MMKLIDCLIELGIILILLLNCRSAGLANRTPSAKSEENDHVPDLCAPPPRRFGLRGRVRDMSRNIIPGQKFTEVHFATTSGSESAHKSGTWCFSPFSTTQVRITRELTHAEPPRRWREKGARRGVGALFSKPARSSADRRSCETDRFTKQNLPPQRSARRSCRWSRRSARSNRSRSSIRTLRPWRTDRVPAPRSRRPCRSLPA